LTDHRPPSPYSTTGTSPPTILFQLPPELIADIASALAERPSEAAPESPYLNTNEAAEYLRAPTSRVHDLVQRGHLTPHKDGRRLLFTREQLRAYVEGGR
jgi:excisionase family DNA binding protein